MKNWKTIVGMAALVLGLVFVFGYGLYIGLIRERGKRHEQGSRSGGSLSQVYGKGSPIRLSASYIDFGTVELANKAQKVVLVKNVSGQQVKLSARASCGCTTVRFASAKLEPGQQTEMHIIFDPQKRGMAGGTTDTVLVISEFGSEQAMNLLTIEAKIQSVFALKPSYVDFLDISRNTPNVRRILIKGPEGYRWPEETKIHWDEVPGLTVGLASNDERPEELIVTVRTSPEISSGQFYTELQIDAPYEKNIYPLRIPIGGYVWDAGAYLRPRRASLDFITTGETKELQCEIRSFDETGVVVEGAESTLGSIEVIPKKEYLQAGTWRQPLTLKLNVNAEGSSGPFRETIHVRIREGNRVKTIPLQVSGYLISDGSGGKKVAGAIP